MSFRDQSIVNIDLSIIKKVVVQERVCVGVSVWCSERKFSAALGGGTQWAAGGGRRAGAARPWAAELCQERNS